MEWDGMAFLDYCVAQHSREKSKLVSPSSTKQLTSNTNRILRMVDFDVLILIQPR